MQFRDFYSFVSQLRGVLNSENFRVHYSLSNPHPGRNDGTSGIHSETFVHSTIHHLERAHQKMSQICGPARPRTGIDGVTHVYVCDLAEQLGGAALTFDDPERGPVIVIPCKNNTPTMEASHQQMRAEAVHETAHVFNFTSRPHTILKQNDPWEWIDEATAVNLERLVLPGNSAYLQYGLKWTDEPETPLDSTRLMYHSFPFVEFLLRRDETIMPRLWRQANAPHSRPLEILSQLLGGTGNPYREPDDNFVAVMRDFFVSAYFCWEFNSEVFLPDVVHRYGMRKHTESLIITDRNTPIKFASAKVDHLSCRYFRIQPKTKHRGIKIVLDRKLRDTRPDLQVVLRPLLHDFNRFQIVDPQGVNHLETGEMEISWPIDEEKSVKIDHYILVVANCGVCGKNGGAIHDDDREFQIDAMLL
jgi:hypothetical protein